MQRSRIFLRRPPIYYSQNKIGRRLAASHPHPASLAAERITASRITPPPQEGVVKPEGEGGRGQSRPGQRRRRAPPSDVGLSRKPAHPHNRRNGRGQVLKASCPQFKGCRSYGETVDEALET